MTRVKLVCEKLKSENKKSLLFSTSVLPISPPLPPFCIFVSFRRWRSIGPQRQRAKRKTRAVSDQPWHLIITFMPKTGHFWRFWPIQESIRSISEVQLFIGSRAKCKKSLLLIQVKVVVWLFFLSIRFGLLGVLTNKPKRPSINKLILIYRSINIMICHKKLHFLLIY